MRAVYLYASTCFFENTVISVGRGTDHPFEVYGSPYLKGMDGYDLTFTPVSMQGAKKPQYEGQVCYGKDLRDISIEEINDRRIDLSYLIDAYNAVKASDHDVSFWGTEDTKGRYWIDCLMGTDEVRKMIEQGMDNE